MHDGKNNTNYQQLELKNVSKSNEQVNDHVGAKKTLISDIRSLIYENPVSLFDL